MKHYNHIIRCILLLVIVVIGFFIARGALVPESFGVHGTYTYGYHRGDSAAEQADRYALYQGSTKCITCHAEQSLLWQPGRHAAVSCESCHGNWQAHNNNTSATIEKDNSVETCMLCHRKLNARPSTFPQIPEFGRHLADQDEQLQQGMLCVDCHDPHDPM